MLKRLVVLAVFMVAAYKPLPVKGSNQQQQPQTNPDKPQPSTPPPPTSDVDKENTANAERYAYYKTHPKEYLKAAIAPANFSNWILAGLGAFGGFLAVCTLLAIKHQANLMEDQTIQMTAQVALMERQINIGINKERAKIFVERANDYLPCLNPDNERKMIKSGQELVCVEIDSFKFVVTNEGESTAYNVSCFCEISVIGQKGEDLLRKRSEETIGIVKAGTRPIIHGIDISPGIADDILAAIHMEQATLNFLGAVSYEDAFEPKNGHVSRFDYEWRVDGEWVGDEEDPQYVDQSGWIRKITQDS
jgi:hypothetical protein